MEGWTFTVTGTAILVVLDGVECRVFTGTDSEGIRYDLFVHRIGTNSEEGHAKLAAKAMPRARPEKIETFEEKLPKHWTEHPETN